MSGVSAIEWTDATWNPLRGCTRVSEGCRHCYAERVAARFSGPGQPYEGLARMTSAGPRWTGEVRLVEKHLEDPLRWRRPRRIFVNSMSDLFHEKVSTESLDRIFLVMALAGAYGRGHVFQVLTKRPERMLEYLTRFATPERWADHFGEVALEHFDEDTDCHVVNAINGVLGEGHNVGWPLSNVWLGVSVENQATADDRIPLLRETPASVHFLSCEPLLGPLSLRQFFLGLGPDEQWLAIVGGESGPNARPMHPDWPIWIREECGEFGVHFFFKQWGEYSPTGPLTVPQIAIDHEGRVVPRAGDAGLYPLGASSKDGWQVMYCIGKKRAGRELDGRTWDEMPAGGAR